MGKNKKDIGLIKDEPEGKIMKEIIAPRPKMYSYLMDNANVKGTKNCVIKQKTKFQDYKKCLEKNKTMLRSQQRFRC